MFGQFNVGDIVYINPSTKEGIDRETGCAFWPEMHDGDETPHVIKIKDGEGRHLRYWLDGNHWCWIDKWLLPADKIDVSLDRHQIESLL